jgi:hypothetical protein
MAGTKVAVAGEFQGQLDVLGMVAFDALHDRGGSGGGEVEAFALRDGEAARIGTVGHHDGNADGI